MSHGTLKKVKAAPGKAQTGRCVPKASDVKSEAGGADVKMEIDESDDVVPDVPMDDTAPADDDDVEMEEMKEKGAPQDFSADAQEEEAATGSRVVFEDGSAAEDVPIDVPKWIVEWEYGT